MTRSQSPSAPVSRASIAVAALLALAVAASPPARAAEPDRERQERAIAIFERGQEQFAAGRYDAAAGLFEEAFETWQDPAYLYNVAFAFERAERWRLAIAWYDKFLARYASSPNAPEVKLRRAASVQSREAARATVMVATTPSGALVQALSEVEPGDKAPSCVAPCELRVDAGPVALRIELGAARVERSKSLVVGERWDLAVDLPAGAIGTTDHTPSWVAWTVGGVGLVSGIILGALASSSYDSGKALADRGPLEERDLVRLRGFREDTRDRSLYADIGFGTALVGATVGTILWFTAQPIAKAATIATVQTPTAPAPTSDQP